MDKDLEIIAKDLAENLEVACSIMKTNDTLNDYTYVNDEDILNSYKKYGGYNIDDIICLIRIERLFGLKYISDEKRKELIQLYKDYKVLSNVICSIEIDTLFGESDVSLSRDEYYKMCANLDKMANELGKYGIIESFQYYDAFINQIDSDIRKFAKKRNNSK